MGGTLQGPIAGADSRFMSINAEFVAVTPEELAQLIDDGSAVESLFVPDASGALGRLWNPENVALLQNLSPETLANAIQNLDPRLQSELTERIERVQAAIASGQGPPMMPLAPARAEPGRRRLSLDKAWHGVHYLLAGDPESTVGLGAVVLGGTDIGEDEGYGPARYFTTLEVAELARALDAPGAVETAAARYDADTMRELSIYPGGWDDDEERDWLLDSLDELRVFFRETATAGDAIVTCLV